MSSGWLYASCMPRFAVGDLTIDLDVPPRFKCEYALSGALVGLDASVGAGFEISGLHLGQRSGVEVLKERAVQAKQPLVRDSATFASFLQPPRTWFAGFGPHLLVATLKKPELIPEFDAVLASVGPAHDPFPEGKETAFSPLRPSHTRFFEQRRTSLLDAIGWSPQLSNAAARLDAFWEELLADPPEDEHLLGTMLSGVAIGFGDLLAPYGFQWRVAKDPWGVSLGVVALEGSSDLLVVPDSFIAKRWERREPPFIADSVKAIAAQVAELKH